MSQGLIDKTNLKLLTVFPKKRFSTLVGRWASLALWPPLARLQSELFSSLAAINREEIEAPMGSFSTLDALFTRRLKPGARPVPGDVRLVLSPADGHLESCGPISGDTLLQAKGLTYSLEALLDDPERAAPFVDGTFITIYLSPHDYHRVHFPMGGEVSGYRHIPGACYPVGTFSRHNVPDLYARNERVVTYLDTPHGAVAVIMVAAMGVGNMTLSFLSAPGAPGVAAGDELGIFHLGSTVVMLFERGMILPPDLGEDQPVTVGTPLTGLLTP